ncbi:hypothetical protein M378DRAFT_158826 [Amanita muscaria Koide BX008]|uniref:Uncharacterized protein n=1 Tax=Amanita muscaria (strain Koide BX008) TaxID=946122 RepID=A0A0C2SXP9_AMAMK|nr:hypothetical protein M378DRAFT_158826 [Amanita muscaria Koide BX008]
MFCHHRLLPYLSKKSISVTSLYPRYIRTKRGLNPYDASLQRDERLLKRLEAQLVDVRAKIKCEESFQNHDDFFWEKVLSKDDRRKLDSHGISSLDDLTSVYNAVEQKLSQPPHPKIESLDAKSRCAYEIYESIPSKLQEAGRRKATSWFDGASF